MEVKFPHASKHKNWLAWLQKDGIIMVELLKYTFFFQRAENRVGDKGVQALAAKRHFYAHASTKCSSEWINHMSIFLCFLPFRACYLPIFPLFPSQLHFLPPPPSVSIPNFTSLGNQYLCPSYQLEHLLPL